MDFKKRTELLQLPDPESSKHSQLHLQLGTHVSLATEQPNEIKGITLKTDREYRSGELFMIFGISLFQGENITLPRAVPQCFLKGLRYH